MNDTTSFLRGDLTQLKVSIGMGGSGHRVKHRVFFSKSKYRSSGLLLIVCSLSVLDT